MLTGQINARREQQKMQVTQAAQQQASAWPGVHWRGPRVCGKGASTPERLRGAELPFFSLRAGSHGSAAATVHWGAGESAADRGGVKRDYMVADLFTLCLVWAMPRVWFWKDFECLLVCDDVACVRRWGIDERQMASTPQLEQQAIAAQSQVPCLLVPAVRCAWRVLVELVSGGGRREGCGSALRCFMSMADSGQGRKAFETIDSELTRVGGGVALA